MAPHSISGTASLVSTLIAIGLLLFLILYCKIHAFFALLSSSLVLGLVSGMSAHAVVVSFQEGIAQLLGSTAVIIGVGAVLGRLIEVSDGGEVVAHTLMKAFGERHIPWAVLIFAYLIGIAMFFDVAFITFTPLVWNLSKSSHKSLLLYAMPLVAALMTTTALIPTNPGPAAASQLLGAEFGRTALFGLVIGVPMAIAGGIVYAGAVSRRVFVVAPQNLMPNSREISDQKFRKPSFINVLTIILLPVTLMGMGVLLPPLFSVDSKVVLLLRFVGHPSIALLLATGLAYLVLGIRLGFRPTSLMHQSSEALNSVGSLILIIGASGAFKQMMIDSGAGSAFVQLILKTRFSPLLMAYLVAAALRIALGSATASIATAGGIIAPIAHAFPAVNPALMVMAVATGGSIFSYVNDAGFWMVKEYCGMTVSQTLKSYSVMKIVASVTGLLIVLVLSRFV